jgi:hypothetical protein
MTLHPPLARPLSGTPRQGLMLAAIPFALACFAWLGHATLGAWFGLAGFVWLVGLTFFALSLSLELAFALMLAGLFLQNAFTAIASPLIQNPAHFSVLLGGSLLNILIMAGFSYLIWLKWRRSMPRDSQNLLLWTSLFLCAIVFYAGLGLVSSSASNVMIYGRIYTVGVMMLIIGVVLGRHLDFGYVLGVIRILTIVLVGWGIFEFLWPYDLYNLFNIRDFSNLKASQLDSSLTFRSVSELVQYNISSYLNLSGQFGLNLDFLRPKGPNLHTISYGYALAFCCLACFINRSVFLGMAAFIMMFLVGTKGPIILTVATLGVFMIYRIARNRYWFLAALAGAMSVYLVGGLIYGYLSDDYHVLGFMGGINGFIKNPLGRGIGVGGNMSSMGIQEANFDVYQHLGAADFALESAFGVMLYQFGIGMAIFLIFYWKLWHNVWKAALAQPSQPRLVMVPAALALLLVNSVFQEEAFSPLGWGLWLMLGGLMVGRYWKQANTDKQATAEAL